MPRSKRLLWSTALLAEFTLILGACFWASRAGHLDHDAALFGLLDTAALVLPLPIQFALWPRGALYRMLVFVLPVCAVLPLVVAVSGALT